LTLELAEILLLYLARGFILKVRRIRPIDFWQFPALL
jgi:hypothetical protein